MEITRLRPWPFPITTAPIRATRLLERLSKLAMMYAIYMSATVSYCNMGPTALPLAYKSLAALALLVTMTFANMVNSLVHNP